MKEEHGGERGIHVMAIWVVRSKTCPCSQGYGSRHFAIPKQEYHTLVSLILVAEALFPEGLFSEERVASCDRVSRQWKQRGSTLVRETPMPAVSVGFLSAPSPADLMH
jgi:hypothetical protein